MDARTTRHLAAAATALVAALGCGTAPHGQAGWQVAVGSAEDEIVVEEEGGRAIFFVSSPRGIGGATIRRVIDASPREIVLRLRLRGLEELRFEYDSTVVTATLPSTAAGEATEEVRTSGGPARRSEAGDRHWIDIRPVRADGRAADRPLPGGWIEVRAPDDFVRGGGREFRVHWIDFYR